MVRARLKKSFSIVLTKYTKRSVERSGTSVLYIGFIVPKFSNLLCKAYVGENVSVDFAIIRPKKKSFYDKKQIFDELPNSGN